MESMASPQMLVVQQEKNLKDKAYPSKTKTNCPNKTKPAFVTALTGRKGSRVEAVTQLLFQCRSACADFAFPSCKAEQKKPLTRKLWYSRQIFSHALPAVSTVAVNRPKSPGTNPTGLCVLIPYSASMLAFLLCPDSLWCPSLQVFKMTQPRKDLGRGWNMWERNTGQLWSCFCCKRKKGSFHHLHILFSFYPPLLLIVYLKEMVLERDMVIMSDKIIQRWLEEISGRSFKLF